MRLFFSTITIFIVHRFIFILGLSESYISKLNFPDLFKFLISCLRFDMMMAGYVLMPLLLIYIFRFFSQKISRIYMLGIFFLISAVSCLDFLTFQLTGDRINQNNLYLSISTFLERIDTRTTIASLFFMITSALFFRKYIQKGEAELRSFGFVKKLVMFLVAAVMARGSFSEHHLDLRHAEVTPDIQSNRLIIPSAYALDQALRNRR